MTYVEKFLALSSSGYDDFLSLTPATITQAQRDVWAKQGVALSDGSWPIPNKDFLRRAILSFGRQAAGEGGKIKAWIKKRAAALGATSMLPEGW